MHSFLLVRYYDFDSMIKTGILRFIKWLNDSKRRANARYFVFKEIFYDLLPFNEWTKKIKVCAFLLGIIRYI